MRNEKVKMNGMYGVEKHNKASEKTVESIREKELKEDGKTSIEMENLKYNKVLKECSETFKEKFYSQLKEKGITKTLRKDAVCMYDGLVAYSPEKTPNLIAFLHRHNEQWKKDHKEQWENYENNYPQSFEKAKQEKVWSDKYFQASVDFYERNMGVVVYAKIHYHEESPHMSINGLPLSQKDGSWSLNWKKAIYDKKSDMSKLQTKFYEEVGKKFGLERGEVKEPEEKKQHKTKLQWQCKNLEEKVKKLQNQVEELNSAYDEARKVYRLLRTPKGSKYEERYNNALNKPLNDARSDFKAIIGDYRGEER